jgi:hypothetical protein
MPSETGIKAQPPGTVHGIIELVETPPPREYETPAPNDNGESKQIFQQTTETEAGTRQHLTLIEGDNPTQHNEKLEASNNIDKFLREEREKHSSRSGSKRRHSSQFRS